MAQKKPIQTTRNTEFNYYKHSDTIESVISYNVNKTYKNIKLLDVSDGVQTSGKAIRDHAKANSALADMGYDVWIDDNDLENISENSDYYIFGAPFKEVLNNRQHYNNCGVESTLNNLAMAGIVKMKENLSDQKKVETNFLKSVWNLNLANDSGEIGVLDNADGGTLPDDYKAIFSSFGIDSTAYYTSSKSDDIQYRDINELGYKISQGYGAVVGVCSGKLWKETSSETGDIRIDHAIAITGVVYGKDSPIITDENGDFAEYREPIGFYIHDTGAWMSRYISLESFLDVTLYNYYGVKDGDDNYDNTKTYDPDYYLDKLREYDAKAGKDIGKDSGGLFITITNEPIKNDMFNLNATGDKNDNMIWGNNGDNIIKGMAGDDILYGGAGDDEIRGGDGKDIIVGNNIHDIDKVIFYDTLEGYAPDGMLNKISNITADIDNITKSGRNTLYGDAGDDIIMGGDDADLIYGGNGNDYIYGGDGRNAVYGGNGNDFMVGGYDNDRLFGDAGNDYIWGFADDDTINGGAGNDHIWGGNGNDRIETGKGNDTVYIEGTKNGVDTISSQEGTTTLKFVDESIDNKGAAFSDMNILLDKDKNNNIYNLEISYGENTENVKDGVLFSEFYNYKKNSAKNVTINDVEDKKYRVSASKSSSVSVANTSTKGDNANINNVLFSLRTKGTTNIKTSTKDDYVYMLGDNDIYSSDYLKRVDKITYTGGDDTYVSNEGNTYYTVKTLDANTTLTIQDNVKALEKIDFTNPILDEQDNIIDYAKKYVVSSDDRLYVGSTKSNLQFFFNVGIDDDGDAVTTKQTGLFLLDKANADEHEDIYATIANGVLDPEMEDASINGFVYMDSFFGVDVEGETVTGRTIDDETDFFGNGRIEHLYYKNGRKDAEYNTFDADLKVIAEQVAGWLSNAEYNIAGCDNAYDAFVDGTGKIDALIQCYAVNA